MSDPKGLPPGVAEDPAAFRLSDDEFAIARERWEEHQRTGSETISVEEFMDELRRAVAKKRAEKR